MCEIFTLQHLRLRRPASHGAQGARSLTKRKSNQVKTLKIIRGGGKPAVVRFIYSAQDRYTSGGEKELRAWLAVALDELPQKDRAEMIAMLLGAAFDAEKNSARRKRTPMRK
jgi:hypothetical protein